MGDSLRRYIAHRTHGDPPDRASLNGSDDKWEGYLLGVEEATVAAVSYAAAEVDAAWAEVGYARQAMGRVAAERDRYKAALNYLAFSGTADPVTECVAADALDLDQPWTLAAAQNQNDRTGGDS